MANWGISKKSSPKEKIKSEYADFLNALNCCGEISYYTYDKLFDIGMKLLDKMYLLKEREKNK